MSTPKSQTKTYNLKVRKGSDWQDGGTFYGKDLREAWSAFKLAMPLIVIVVERENHSKSMIRVVEGSNRIHNYRAVMQEIKQEKFDRSK